MTAAAWAGRSVVGAKGGVEVIRANGTKQSQRYRRDEIYVLEIEGGPREENKQTR